MLELVADLPFAACSSERSQDAVRAHFDINFFSLLTTIQAALPHLRTSNGSIVLVSSGAAERGYSAWGPYCAGKAAMNSLARTLGTEEDAVTTVAIRPGVVDTGVRLSPFHLDAPLLLSCADPRTCSRRLCAAQMQTLIRATGGDHMLPSDFEKFTSLHSKGELLNPNECAPPPTAPPAVASICSKC